MTNVARWIQDEEATATAEFVLVFPIMFTMMLAMWDLGNGILANQKAISASQMVADLVGRQIQITQDQVDDALTAGELALLPFETGDGRLEIEIVSVAFEEDDEIDVRWSDTLSGDAADEEGLGARAAGLGSEGEGAIVVRVSYEYQPTFSLGPLLENIDMQEIAYSRGRRTGIVTKIP